MDLSSEVRPHLSLQKLLCSPHFWMCGVEVKKPDWNKLISTYCGNGKRSVTLPLPMAKRWQDTHGGWGVLWSGPSWHWALGREFWGQPFCSWSPERLQLRYWHLLGHLSSQGTCLLWILNIKRASITQRLKNLFHLKHPIHSSFTGPAFMPAVRTLVYHREIFWGHEVIIYVTCPLLQGQSFWSSSISEWVSLVFLDVCNHWQSSLGRPSLLFLPMPDSHLGEAHPRDLGERSLEFELQY